MISDWKESALSLKIQELLEAQIKDLSLLSNFVETIELGEGEVVIEEGRVVIRKRNQVLATLTAGDYFGEMSFIDVPRRSASATVQLDAQVLVIRRNQFLQLLKQDSELAAKLMWQLLQKMSRTVRATNRRVVSELTEYDGNEVIGNAAGDTILEDG